MSLKLIDLKEVYKRRGPEPELEVLMNEWSKILREGCLESKTDIAEYRFEELVAIAELGLTRVPVGSKGECVPLEKLGLYDDVKGDRYRVFNSTVELLTNNWPTPLVRLRSLSDGGYSVWAKLEWYNPYSFSVKDRIGWYMVKKALEKGKKSERVFEATSTNTGMALAAMAAVNEFSVKLFIPKSIQKASDILLKALGAEVIRTDKPLTVDSIEDVKKAASAEGAFHINQFENDANFMAHLRYTAKELDLQLRTANIDAKAIVGGLGTSGHLSAISFYFKNRYGNIKVFGVQPAPKEVIPGIRRIETGMKWVHMVQLDGVVDITLKEAIEALLRVARKDGILPGLSSGAVTAAFLKLREEGVIEEGSYVLIYPDNGLKYVEQLSKYFGGEL